MRKIKVESIRPGVQFRFAGTGTVAGDIVRGSVIRSEDSSIYVLRYFDGAERSVEVRKGTQVWMDYAIDADTLGAMICDTHDLVARHSPKGPFLCTACMKAKREVVKARRAEGTARTHSVSLESRRAAERDAAANAKVDRLMAMLASRGLLLSQQAS